MSSQPKMPTDSGSLIHILLATYQGAAYLREQLDSIAAQQHTNWMLWISDDGSKDTTWAICESFAAQHPNHRVHLIKGPAQGPTANFFHLLNAVQLTQRSDLLAFADQDDVWLPEKLSRAAAALGTEAPGSNRPYLYGATTHLVDEQLRPTGLSAMPGRPLGFGNALLQNVISGNTMVFNAALLDRLRRIRPEHAVWHDWSAYQTATGCGGHIHFDPLPCLLYRQHDGNLVGSQGRAWDKIVRLTMLFRGQYRDWGNKTEAAMADLNPILDKQARETLRVFSRMRHHHNPLERLRLARTGRLWRQTAAGRASLWLGLLFRQI
ncbi:MAG TPA: glycosyltransferase family 2 protein [Hydrogenophaga sp.]